MRSKKPTRSAETKAWWTRHPGTMGPWTISLVVCLVAAAVLIAARQPSQPADLTTAKRPAVAQTAQAAPKTAAARTDAGATAMAKGAAATTIVGCLEKKNETFRLEDTTGKDTPKSRSWKSGFLKKGSASIDVVDSTKRLNLANHTGKRVSVTGVLADREMRASSVRRVGGSCD